MNTRWTLIALVALYGVAVASIVTTETSGPTVMHAGDVTKTFRDDPKTGKTGHEQCVEALPLGDGTCGEVTNVKKVGTCTDEAPKDVPLVKDVDGYLVLQEARAKQISDTEWTTEQWAYVKGPGYPNCWIPGWADITEWDSNGKFEGPGVNEPTGWPQP